MVRKKEIIKKRIAAVLALLLFIGICCYEEIPEAISVSASEKKESTQDAVSEKEKSKKAKASETPASESGSAALKEAEKEKKALEAELDKAKETIAALRNSKGNVEAKVAELNTQLMEISVRITELENALTEKNEDIVEAKEELAAAKVRERQQYEDMKVRIQYMYENSHRNYLEVLLNAENLADLLNMVDYIAEIESYDRQKLEEFQQTIVDIDHRERQLQQDYADLEQMKVSVEENKASVAAMMREKEQELASLTEDIGATQLEAAYYEAEIQAQEELIAAIKRAEAEKAAAGKAKHPYTGGAFLWPCPSSTRITSEYGPREAPISGASSDHKGIDIGANAGADIIAVAGGTVRAAAYSSSAGNYVMIDHEGGLYTVYMHASELLVEAGDEVKAGQVIAKVGSTGVSTGNHLHFGVSLDGVYVSPWDYLGG